LFKLKFVLHFKALDCAKRLVDKTSVLNRRTLDLLAAKCYFYYARIFELNNMLDTIRPYVIKFSKKKKKNFVKFPLDFYIVDYVQQHYVMILKEQLY
jgi:hypothetical protein